ncbi:sugar transferase [Pseudanabaena sp. PCC 6802]|uniref:sugar transferase n=1 Tax=Pseudanabaena sp. PCC 6802 TaxID=118173 RepID=UPI00034B0CC1|nr:sugar transferase [Pseudanabaena sp. PCC 6802]
MQSQRKLKVVQPDQPEVRLLAGKKIVKVLSEQNLQSLDRSVGEAKNNLLQQELHCSASSKAKRFIDVVGAIAGLIITAIIFIPIAVAIYIDSPGSVLYSQIRCGLQGNLFTIWKFRTMCTDADRKQHLVENEVEGHVFKNKNDPRVTRVGKFLRSTSLDEFPQFWNVLKGEMSLVGTRPPTPNEVEKYEGHHYQRLLVRPGITGEWQVRGRSGVKSFDDIVRLDIDYQRKWSPLYDLSLIVQTIGVVFKRDGAY